MARLAKWREDVRHAGPGDHDADARAVGHAAVAVGHEAGALLVARHDVADAARGEPTVDLERVHAGNAEHDVDAALLEQARHGGAAGGRGRRHRRPSRTGVRGRPSRRQAVTLAACLRSASSSPSRLQKAAWGVTTTRGWRSTGASGAGGSSGRTSSAAPPSRPLVEGREQCVDVEQRAAGAIDDERATWHQAERRRVEQRRRAADGRRVQREHVGGRQQLIEPERVRRPEARRPPARGPSRRPARRSAPPAGRDGVPVRPMPTMPSVSDDGRWRGPVAKHPSRPSRACRSRNGTCRTRPSAIASDVVATSSVVASGTLATHAPCTAAASRSMWSTPTVTVETMRELRQRREHLRRDRAVADEQRRRRPARPRRPPTASSRRRRARRSRPPEQARAPRRAQSAVIVST